jgi:rubrerythrin
MKKFESVNEILDFAIEAEQDAVDFYTSLASQAKNNEMKLVFEEFAKEEVAHKARLEKIKVEQIFVLEIGRASCRERV